MVVVRKRYFVSSVSVAAPGECRSWMFLAYSTCRVVCDSSMNGHITGEGGVVNFV